MVESQRRKRIDGKPLSLCSIILASDCNGTIHKHQIGYCYGAPSWVTIHFRVSTYLLKIGDHQPCLLLQFTNRTLFRGFVHIHEPAWECPAALEGFCAPFNQQHLWLCFFGDDHTVSGHCRSWIFIAICHSVHYIYYSPTISFHNQNYHLAFKVHILTFYEDKIK